MHMVHISKLFKIVAKQEEISSTSILLLAWNLFKRCLGSRDDRRSKPRADPLAKHTKEKTVSYNQMIAYWNLQHSIHNDHNKAKHHKMKNGRFVV